MLTGPAQAAPDPFGDFLAKNRCPVAVRLQHVFEAGDPTKDNDRFLVVTMLEHKHGYVQCLFHDNETRFACEAASGYWYDADGAPRTMFLAPNKIAALARLGFSTDDSKGNFSLDLPRRHPARLRRARGSDAEGAV